jgi:glycosyltransferase involved in cell wall biosynthesis
MKLTVVILTYNHEKFIRQTLEGIRMQETNFKFNIVIADDGSTDETKKEIELFKSTTIIPIQDFYSSSNSGVLKNALGIFNKIEGEYVAFVDGDDYWSSPLKLQQQVDFLDSNSDYSGCFHDTSILSDLKSSAILFGNSKKYSEIYKYNNDIYPSDILKRLIIPTSSLVLRSAFLKKLDLLLFKDDYSIIWKLCCLAIVKSKFYYLNEIMSVYRNHAPGISKSNNVKFHNSHALFLQSLTKRIDFKDYLLDIYSALTKEYTLVLERSLKKDTQLQKIFYLYFMAELKKNYYFYQSIFK